MYEHSRLCRYSNGRLRVHTQHEFASFSVENFLDEVEMRKTPYADEESDITLAKFKHRSVLDAATQETGTCD